MAGTRFLLVSALTRGLQAVPVLALLWVALRVASSDVGALWESWPWIVVDVWMLFEGMFLLFQLRRMRDFAAAQARSADLSMEERREAFQGALQLSGSDMNAFLSSWFHNAPIEDIYRENLVEWLAWAFFSQSTESVSSEGIVRLFAPLFTFIDAV